MTMQNKPKENFHRKDMIYLVLKNAIFITSYMSFHALYIIMQHFVALKHQVQCRSRL